MKADTCLFLVVLLASVGALVVLLPSSGRNNGVHLAVSPQCGVLVGNTSDVNAGLNLLKYKTIVSFGDSYTDGGKYDGSPLNPAVIIHPNPFAGGRSTNGKLWIEYIADDYGIKKFKDYAISGAVTNLSLWPSNPRPVDFLGESQAFAVSVLNITDSLTYISTVKTFLDQSNRLDPQTTLYTVFFGINDFIASLTDGNRLPEAAQVIIDQIRILASPPTNGRDFLVTGVYGRGVHTPIGDAFTQRIFEGLRDLHYGPSSLNVAFVDFARIWDGVLGADPGHRAFGYTSTSNCVNGPTTVGICNDPEHHFYWFAGHPTKETMRIMADYVKDVLSFCVSV